MGADFFLPHFRTDAVRGVVVALGIAEAPIAAGERDTGAARGAEPRMILLIVASPRDTATYLQTVAAFARVLSRDDVANALLAARSPGEVLALPALREQELEGQLRVRDMMRAEIVALRPEDTLATRRPAGSTTSAPRRCRWSTERGRGARHALLSASCCISSRPAMCSG